MPMSVGPPELPSRSRYRGQTPTKERELETKKWRPNGFTLIELLVVIELSHPGVDPISRICQARERREQLHVSNTKQLSSPT